MPEQKHIEIEVHGEELIMERLSAHEESAHEFGRETVRDLSRFATTWLISTVPRRTTYLWWHIDRTPTVWVPGGAGGGGTWEAIAGIKAGESKHPIYVEFGTGIYAGRGLIFAHTYFPMTFQKRGEPRRFRMWTKGQPGQHYFYETWRSLNIYAVPRIATKFFTK